MSEMTAALPAAEVPQVSRRRGLHPVALGVLAAGAWWLLGHAPWVLAGLRPGSPGTAEALGLPADVRLAVPLLSTLLADLVVYGALGGIAAGVLGLFGRGRRSTAALATLLGVLAGLMATLAQSVQQVQAHPGAFAADGRVVAGLATALVGSTLAGWALGSCALLGRPGLGLALAVPAGALPGWLAGVVLALQPAGSTASLGDLTSWAAAALLAAALVCVGLRPPVRGLYWPVVLLVAWLVQPVTTAAVYLSALLRPGAGLPGALPESLAAARQVFGAASALDARPLTPWLVAVAGALVVAGWLAVSGRRGAPTLTG